MFAKKAVFPKQGWRSYHVKQNVHNKTLNNVLCYRKVFHCSTPSIANVCARPTRGWSRFDLKDWFTSNGCLPKRHLVKGTLFSFYLVLRQNYVRLFFRSQSANVCAYPIHWAAHLVFERY